MDLAEIISFPFSYGTVIDIPTVEKGAYYMENKMKLTKYLLISLAFFSFTDIGFSIPQFAKKYGISCFTCHAAVPKLNAFGEAFRRNGFQAPGTMDPTPVWQQDVLPLSGMPHPMFMRKNVTNNMAVSTINAIPSGKTLSIDTFNNAFELFSAGTTV